MTINKATWFSLLNLFIFINYFSVKVLNPIGDQIMEKKQMLVIHLGTFPNIKPIRVH